MNLIPHAGGEYVRRHLSALSEFYDVTIIGPGSSENIEAALRVHPSSADVLLIPYMSQGFQKLCAPLRLLYKAVLGASLGLEIEFRLKRDPAVRQALLNADAIGFQWTESAALSQFVRRIAPQAKQTLVIHDVLAQRWLRASQGAHGLASKVFYYLRYISARRAEKLAFASVDTVVAFSEKDAQMAMKIQPLANVVVVNPPLIDDAMPASCPQRTSDRKSVLFTGALNRPENHEAAMWFLAEIWPAVIDAVPEAEFTIAGASPLHELADRARNSNNVVITGFVEDLNEYYSSANVFVVPLHRGAGVKFKTITAMLWGLPIVTTDVGAEGIGGAQHFVAVTNRPKEFIDAIVESLIHPESNSQIIQASFHWARSRYSLGAFREALESISTSKYPTSADEPEGARLL